LTWEETVEEYGRLVEDALRARFASIRREGEAYHPYIGGLYTSLEEYVSRRGMRFASFSAYLTYKGYGGVVDDRIRAVCAGLELYRHSILVHDDLVDGDEARRGGRAFHKLIAERYDDRFGEGVAVFMGNALFALAQEAVLNSGFDASKAGQVAALMAEGYRRVNESQVLDLLFEYREPSLDEWHVMASRRAASLFTLALKTGGILADASNLDLALLEEAGVHMGYSFDIQDDIIDTFATEEQYGRAPGGDLAQGKRPLHVMHALQRASEEDRAFLAKVRGEKPMPLESLEHVRSIIRETGALDAAKNASKKHAERAKALIAKTGLGHDAKRLFDALITYVEESLEWYR